ncbi:MAG: 50S ribosomal protein L21 [Phycisphaeraceae bacterium]
MYAIIEDSGTQIKVSEGDVIRVDQRELPENSASLTFDRVLMVGGEGEPKIGQPVVEGAKVTADILSDDVSEKTEVIKFKRRKKYRRRKGHRQHFIQVRVTGIEA